ncbi:MAG: hypothetical protein ACK5Q5_22050 [Planctomycetaceae bacterium]
MSRNEARRQKKLAKHKKDRQQRQRQLSRNQNLSMAAQIMRWESGLIVDSLIGSDLEATGIGQALISRRAGSGQIAVGVFLIDRYCLGVKNIICSLLFQSEYSKLIERLEECGVEDANPSTVRRLVEDAVTYARNLGFAPHQEYAAARLIFGNIDPSAADYTFEMGRDGKPFFVAGPYESRARIRFILSTLEQHCGQDGFDYFFCDSEMEPGPHFQLVTGSDLDLEDENEFNTEDPEEGEESPFLPSMDIEPPPRLFW